MTEITNLRIAPNVTTSVTNSYLESAYVNSRNLAETVAAKTQERDDLIKRAQQLNTEIEELVVIQHTNANMIAQLEKAKING